MTDFTDAGLSNLKTPNYSTGSRLVRPSTWRVLNATLQMLGSTGARCATTSSRQGCWFLLLLAEVANLNYEAEDEDEEEDDDSDAHDGEEETDSDE